MRSAITKPYQISTKTRMRFPRTNDLKRSGRILRSPNRPPNFESWLTQPLACFVGRFRRLRRELITKEIRAEYIRAQLMGSSAELVKELSIG